MGAAGLVSGTWGSAIVRVQPSGEVAITTGAQPHGRSQETTFAQIAASRVGIPVGMISVFPLRYEQGAVLQARRATAAGR